MKHIPEHWLCGCCDPPQEFREKSECFIHETKNRGLRIYNPGFGSLDAEDVTRCIANVSEWHEVQCSRPRGYGEDGLYCKQHAKRHPAKETP